MEIDTENPTQTICNFRNYPQLIYFIDLLYLGGGFNPSEKYARQIGNLPQIGVKIKNNWNHHPEYTWSIYFIFKCVSSDS